MDIKFRPLLDFVLQHAGAGREIRFNGTVDDNLILTLTNSSKTKEAQVVFSLRGLKTGDPIEFQEQLEDISISADHGFRGGKSDFPFSSKF